MLLWLSTALEPMTLKELSEAIIIGEGPIAIDDEIRLLNPKDLLEVCSSLISFNNHCETIALAHSSVLDYLSSSEIQTSEARQFYLDPEARFQAIPKRCISYLLQPAFSSGCCVDQAEFNQRLDDWPLLSYIGETLFVHIELADINDPELRKLILRLFETHRLPGGGNFGTWVQAFIPDTVFNIESSTPLYYAARAGFVLVVRLILRTQGTEDLEKLGGVYGCTPLHVASWAGRAEVVKELLSAGANAKETNFDGRSGLYWAVQDGNHLVERMLRDAGATLDQ